MMSKRRYFNPQLVYAFLGSSILTLFVCFLYFNGSLQWFDFFVYDYFNKIRSAPTLSKNITLVLLDEKSSIELKRQRGTWSREHLARSIKNLCEAEAEIIGLDMILSAPDPNPEVDQFLADVIYDCNNVVLGRVSAARGVNDIPALPIFQDAMIGDGFLDVFMDGDEVLRRMRFLNAKPLEDGSLMLLPSFALEIARTYLNIEFEFDFSQKEHFLLGSKHEKQIKLPYPELIINYTGNYQNFNLISFADLVSGRFSKELVAGKIVLLGSSLAIQKDFFVTPYTRFQKISHAYKEKFGKVVQNTQQQKDLGVACHAYAVDTILKNNFIRRLPDKLLYGFLIAVGMAGIVFYHPRVRILPAAFLAGSGILLSLACAYYFFTIQLLWIDIASFCGLIFLQYISGTSVQIFFEKRRTERVTNLFGRYVSPAVVKELVADDIGNTLSGQRREVTIFFSDIRGFTTFSENLGAKDTAYLLNAYFDVMIPLIFQNNGTLDKLIGDAVMAFFGAPITFADHPEKAAVASLEMLEALREFRKKDIKGAKNIDIGIGLNTGEVTIGNLGSDNFMDYTVIGDSVNLASRLEGLNKVYGTRILLTKFTAEKLSDTLLCRELDTVKVKGKESAVGIYELVDFSDNVEDNTRNAFEIFASALKEYRCKEWDEARKKFKQVLHVLPEDGPSLLYLERISQCRKISLPADWNGVTEFKTK